MIVLTELQNFITNQLLNQTFDSYHGYRRQFISIVGGYAGTGKTTLICELRKRLNKYKQLTVAFLTFTGKASSVLKAKLTINNTNLGLSLDPIIIYLIVPLDSLTAKY